MRYLLVVVVAVLACAGLRAASVLSEKRVELFFRPLTAQQTALSPDGRYLAYTEQVSGDLTIVVFDLERMERTTRILADDDRPIVFSREKRHVSLRFMQWASNHRLVFAPTIEVVPAPASPPPGELLALMPSEALPNILVTLAPKVLAPIMVVEATGRNPRQLADAKDFKLVVEPIEFSGRSDIPADLLLIATPEATPGRRIDREPEIHGFLPSDRSQLLFVVRGHLGEPTQMIAMNVETGVARPLHSEAVPGRTIYDWQGRPRLCQLTEQGQEDYSFLIREADSTQWRRLEPPRGVKDGVRFQRAARLFHGERAMPLGFDFDPNVLIYASNIGRDTFGIYGLDTRTWQRTSLRIEHPQRDLVTPEQRVPASSLVFDPHRQTFAGVRVPGSRPCTVWVDADAAGVQHTLDARFPQRNVEIVEWDAARHRYIFRVSGGSEPGWLGLFERPSGVAVELFRFAPWIERKGWHETRFFELAGADGGTISGYLTLPQRPRLQPAPLVVWFAPGLPPRAHSEYAAQAEVLADLGFVVCRLNPRGIVGTGSAQREALRRDIDRAPAADAMAAIEWIASRHAIDRKRVATLGEGFAAFHAIRATQLYPEAFRCAVVIEPKLTLRAAFQSSAAAAQSYQQRANEAFLLPEGVSRGKLSVLMRGDENRHPVFVAARAATRSPADATEWADISQLRLELGHRDLACMVVGVLEDFSDGLPAARTRVYRQMEEFLNLHLYDYDVKIGKAREVK